MKHYRRYVSDSSSEEESECQKHNHQSALSDFPPSYWEIQKLMKYAKVGNESATVIALCALQKFDFNQHINCISIEDAGGILILLNLVNSNIYRCQVIALRILFMISHNNKIKKSICLKGGIKCLMTVIQKQHMNSKILATKVIANLCLFSGARHEVNMCNGVRILINQLRKSLNNSNSEIVDQEACHEIAQALCNLSKSRKIQVEIQQCGGIDILSAWLKVEKEHKVLVVIVGIFENCMQQENVKKNMETAVVKSLVQLIKSDDDELKLRSINALTECAELSEVKDTMRLNDGLGILVGLLNKGSKENNSLLAATAHALWKFSIKCVQVKNMLHDLKAIELLICLSYNQTEEIMTYAIGTLGECADLLPVCTVIRKQGGISNLIELLNSNNPDLLFNVINTLLKCMIDKESFKTMERLDCARKFWSLLKTDNAEVQAISAKAISTFLSITQNSSELVRSYAGGLELTVRLLQSPHQQVQASACHVIANIAEDDHNLQVMSDLGIEQTLVKLASTENIELKTAVAFAITKCCKQKNLKKFSRNNSLIRSLASNMNLDNEDLKHLTTKALHNLSYSSENCARIFNCQLVPNLIAMLEGEDDVQDAAAGCLYQIRKLAMEQKNG